MAEKYIVNSLLCFLNSSKKDTPSDTLIEVIHSFYSHEEIKKAKEEICTIAKKSLPWRRDHDKKRKDLIDILDVYEGMENLKDFTFVTDTHKRMPPIGLEIFGPMLAGLAEEVTKINELLPKILDMKTEVLNTADTVRQMRSDVCDLKTKFYTAIGGLQEATKDVMEEVTREITKNDVDILEDLTSLRLTEDGRRSKAAQQEYAEAVKRNPTLSIVKKTTRNREAEGRRLGGGATRISGTDADRRSGGLRLCEKENEDIGVLSDAGAICSSPASLVTDTRTGALSKGFKPPDYATSDKESLTQSTERRIGIPPSTDDWKQVLSRKARRTGGVRGQRKCEGTSFKGAIRFVDVFIGRVDKEVQCEDIENYIKDVMGIEVRSVIELVIRSDDVKAFKVTLKLADREKLFNSELWPEDVVVDKFYNRSGGRDRQVT